MTSPADTSSEPSIEEILDSIRQIIADDEETPPAQAAAPSKPAAPQPSADDILELTERVQEASKAPAKDILVDMKEFEPEAAPPPPVQPKPEPRRAMTPPPAAADSLESIMTQKAEAATMEAFSELAQRAAIEKGGGITIEDVVRYEVRPLLRAWIDKYLPGIVERLVQKELDKIGKRFEQD